jgi:tartrate-resistant acid phosphatase type 5
MMYAHCRWKDVTPRQGRLALFVTLAWLALVVPLIAAEPASTQAGPGLRFLVVSDIGGKASKNQVTVAEQMGRTAAAEHCSFVVTCGDNYHGNGIDSETSPRWKPEFEEVYKAPALMVPWYATLGNHEYRGQPDAEVGYSRLSPRWKMPARYYSHVEKIDDQNEALFVHLDTSPLVASYRKAGSGYHVEGQDAAAQLRWLDRVLSTSSARWKVVIGHHPIFSAAGMHGNTQELIAEVLPLLEKNGVRIYCSGHDHILEHLAHGNLNFFICGGGSAPRTAKQRSDVRFGVGSLGFLSMTLTPTEAKAEFVSGKGKDLYHIAIAAP